MSNLTHYTPFNMQGHIYELCEYFNEVVHFIYIGVI